MRKPRTMVRGGFRTMEGEPVEITISEFGLVTFNGNEWYAVPQISEWEESYFGFGGYWFTSLEILKIGWAIETAIDQFDAHRPN